MPEQTPSTPKQWTIQPGDLTPFVYDPRVHSRRYVLAQIDRYPPDVADSILRQAEELEAQALGLGFSLADQKHGTEEVGNSQPAPFA